VQNDIVNVPFRGPQARFSDKRLFVFAPEDGAGSQTVEPNRVLIVEDDFLIASETKPLWPKPVSRLSALSPLAKKRLNRPSRDLRIWSSWVLDSPATATESTRLELFRAHGVRCLFASAYSDQETRQRADPAAPLGWPQKPYTVRSLTAMVRQAVKELLREKGP
jgi:two-component system, response regulator PdtaR